MTHVSALAVADRPGGVEQGRLRRAFGMAVDDVRSDAVPRAVRGPARSGQGQRAHSLATEHMRAWEPFPRGLVSVGEDLVNRPFRCVTDEKPRRLDELCDRWDAAGRFMSWLGWPTQDQLLRAGPWSPSGGRWWSGRARSGPGPSPTATMLPGETLRHAEFCPVRGVLAPARRPARRREPRPALHAQALGRTGLG